MKKILYVCNENFSLSQKPLYVLAVSITHSIVALPILLKNIFKQNGENKSSMSIIVSHVCKEEPTKNLG